MILGTDFSILHSHSRWILISSYSVLVVHVFVLCCYSVVTVFDEQLNFYDVLNRRSYMIVHMLLDLSNVFRKSDTMQGRDE